MKIAFHSAVSKSFAVVAATFAVAPLAHAQVSVTSPSSTSTAPKTAPAKSYNRALNADLRAAVQSNDVKKVRSLLSRNADPDPKDNGTNLTSLLGSAASNGYLEIVRALVEAGADTEKGDLLLGNAPLILASINGRDDVIRYLLQKGANLETNKYAGTTPLMIAAGAGQMETVRLLLKSGANIHARSTTNGTPLIYACGSKGNLEIVKMLVEAGADVSVVSSGGKRADEIAVDNKLRDINIYLVDIFNRDAALYNVTAKAIRELKTATSSTRLERWQEFKDELAKGANPRYSSSSGTITTLTNLIIALSPLLATLDDNDATMKTVIARSDLDAKANNGDFTALLAAVDQGNAQVVKWLIKAGANLNLADAKNQTPLDLALKEKRQDIIPLLKDAGAKTYEQLQNPSAAAPTPSTPVAPPTPVVAAPPANTIAKSPLDVLGRGGKSELMEAAYDGDTTKIAQLLKRGASVDFANEEGHTPLFFAAYGGSANAINALIKAGADINYLDRENKTPLVSASFAGEVDTIRALVEAGADLKYLNAAIGYANFGKNTAVIEYLTALKAKGAAQSTPVVPTTAAPASRPAPKPTNQPQTAPYKSTPQDVDLHFALTIIQYKRNVEQNVPDSDWRAVRVALLEGATARYADKDGVTALMIIAVALPGAADEIERQIFGLADINAQDKEGSTALHYAAKNGYNKMVEWLIAAKADLNILDSNKRTPLDMAKIFQQGVAIIALENAGAKRAAELKVATPSTPAAAKTSTTAFIALLQQKTFDAQGAEALFKSGADLNAFDSGDKTLLMRASEAGTVEAVAWLLTKKVAVNAADKNGMTALMYGADRADDDVAWDIVVALLDAGAQWKMKNKDGKTAYDLAVAKSNDWTVMAFEIEMGS